MPLAAAGARLPLLGKLGVHQAQPLIARQCRSAFALVRLAPTRFRPFAHVVSTQRLARSCVNAIGLGYDNVQAADEPDVQVTCLARAQAHLVNPKTGKVLGSDVETAVSGTM